MNLVYLDVPDAIGLFFLDDKKGISTQILLAFRITSLKMNQPLEVKYRKFSLQFGERLADVPSFQHLRKSGWRVAWSNRSIESGIQYVETLLRRSGSVSGKA